LVSGIRVKVKLLGVLKAVAGVGQIDVDLGERCTVAEVLETLFDGREGLRKAVWDTDLNTYESDALVLLNGVEVGNLRGVDSLVGPGDELVLLSVAHGG
jgi:molybdopterin converting factor small subunit